MNATTIASQLFSCSFYVGQGYRLTGYGDSRYTYSDNGDLESQVNEAGTTHYNYDATGALVQVTIPQPSPANASATVIRYAIDGMGRRVAKYVDDQLERGWVYKDKLNPIAELDGTGAIVSRFIYAEKAHVPSAMIKMAQLTVLSPTS